MKNLVSVGSKIKKVIREEKRKNGEDESENRN